MKELEIELTIPSGMKLKGVRTEGNTIIAVVETVSTVRRVGFITDDVAGDNDEENEDVEDTIHA